MSDTNIISKELLSEVLGYEVCTDGYMKENDKDSVYWGMIGCRAIDDCEEYEESINIHQLAHMCKEWARTEASEKLYTEHLVGVNYPSSCGEKPKVKNYDMWICFSSLLYKHRIGIAETEPEAIFKACQRRLEDMKGD